MYRDVLTQQEGETMYTYRSLDLTIIKGYIRKSLRKIFLKFEVLLQISVKDGMIFHYQSEMVGFHGDNHSITT